METTLKIGVKAFLRNPKGMFLLAKRSESKYPGVAGHWDIIGGRINPGSTLIENLKREIKEETGLELTSEPQLINAQDILRVEGVHTVRLTYLAEISGEPALNKQSGEEEELKWFSLEEIKKLEDLDMYTKLLLATNSINILLKEIKQ